MLAKTRRFIFIINTVTGYGLNLLIGQKTGAQKWLFERLFRLGGVYIKFLQLLALRDDVSDLRFAGLKDALAVFDQVIYEKVDIRKLLHAELGPKASHLSLNCTVPFAAGSFAQVYKATFDNQPVVIKVMRPSVSKFLVSDLMLIGIVARAVSLLQPQSMVNTWALFKNFKQIILGETDYIREAQTARRLGNHLANHPVIHIPKTYSEFSTRHIIVQEYINGVSLSHLLDNDITDKRSYIWNNLNTNLEYVMEELAVELIGGNLTPIGAHGDPHPGNVYILPNNQVALIDFGIDSIVSEHQPQFIKLLRQYVALYGGEFNPAQFTEAMIDYFAPDLTQSIQTLSVYLGKQDLVRQTLDEFGNAANKTIRERSTDPLTVSLIKQYRVFVLMKLINENNRFGLRANLETPAFLRTANMFLTMVHKLNCDKQLLRRAFERVLNTNAHLEAVQSPRYDNESIDRSLHTVANWFERLHYSDPALYNRLIQKWESTL